MKVSSVMEITMKVEMADACVELLSASGSFKL